MRRNYYGKTIIDFARTSLAEIMAELVKSMGAFSPLKIKNIRKCLFSLVSRDFANLTIATRCLKFANIYISTYNITFN